MDATTANNEAVPEVDVIRLKAVVNAACRAKGLTRVQLARAAGVGRTTVYDWLSGKGSPAPNGLAGLARALDMTVTQLLDRAGCAQVGPVQAARLNRGWTRGQLAEAARVSFSTVRALECGQAVRPDAATRVAAALGIDHRDLLAQTSQDRSPTELGRLLDAARLNHGWTVAQLARHLGATRQLVSAWLLGHEPVATRWYPALAELLGCDEARVAALGEQHRQARPGQQVGQWLRAARARAGLTRAELAARLDVAVTTVEQWERGRREPSATHQARLRRLLDDR